MQSTNKVLLIRPAEFQFNEETAINNKFQNKIESAKRTEKILEEFDLLVNTLMEEGVDVTVIADTPKPVKPDAIFPNNWVSFNADSTVHIYPMFAANRRTEKRKEIINGLIEKYQIGTVHDFSYFEKLEMFLEGTGSIVFDHIHKIGYAAISERTDPTVFSHVIKSMGYASISFSALDDKQFPIYHTNVMLTIGTGYAIICLESITDSKEKQNLMQSLTNCNIELISITQDQVTNFCGNMLELINKDGEKLLMLSQRAYDHLTQEQRSAITKYARLKPVKTDTIETIGGGGVRCMITEIFCPGI